MDKEELEKLIINCDTIWYISPNGIRSETLNSNFVIKYVGNCECLMRNNDLVESEEYICILQLTFKTQAQARHHLDHANVVRIDELPFVTWEEFKNGKCVEFVDWCDECIRLSVVADSIILGTSCEVIKEYGLTEENFYKAYDECVKLFKGE